MAEAQFGDQLALPGLPKARSRRPRKQDGIDITDDNPVAAVLLDLPALHLDRPFDYLVPEKWADQIQPGVRVSVRFGSRNVDGIVLERRGDSQFDGQLQPIRRVISSISVAPAHMLAVYRHIADYYAAAMSQIVNVAIPPRHARTEALVKELPPAADDTTIAQSGTRQLHDIWQDYHGGSAFITRLAAGQKLRAAWTVTPNAAASIAPWVRGIVSASLTQYVAGRAVMVIVPDDRDVNRVMAGFRAAGLADWSLENPKGQIARLQASQGPAERYGAYLAALLGRVRIVVGTRAAAFAPVHDLSLVIVWDDSDNSHASERHPHTHTTEVIRMRAEVEDISVLVAGIGMSLRMTQLVETGWARHLEADRGIIRQHAPRVRAVGEIDREASGGAGYSRLPPQVWRMLRAGLDLGPVLVQVPRAGYIPAVACARCRHRAQCKKCSGPLQITQTTDVNQPLVGAHAQCSWCGTLAGHWRCPECGHTHLRSVAIGSQRTAEELGRAFPRTAIKLSGLGTAAGVIDRIENRRCLVVATPGAEPIADGGYTAAAILDAEVAVGLPRMDAEVEAVHRWFMAASLVRPASQGGNVAIVADSVIRPVQALVRWDPAGYARRELAERVEAQLPPAYRFATISGDHSAVAELLREHKFSEQIHVLGPAPIDRDAIETHQVPGSSSQSYMVSPIQPEVRALLKAPMSHGLVLAKTLKAALGAASASRRIEHLSSELDPGDL